MVVTRASGTDLASNLKQNTFLTRLAPADSSPPPRSIEPACLSTRPSDSRERFIDIPSAHTRAQLKVKSLFCFKLDAMSVPEAPATTIRILLMFSIVLANRWNPGVWARPTTRERVVGTPSVPPQVQLKVKNMLCLKLDAMSSQKLS